MLDTASLDQAREDLEKSIARNREQHTEETRLMLRIDRLLHVEALLETLFAAIPSKDRTGQLWSDYTDALATLNADRLELRDALEKLDDDDDDCDPHPMRLNGAEQ